MLASLALSRAIMSRLRIRERVARKRRALVVLACRSYCDHFSSLWFMYNLTFVYAMARLALDDTPTDLARRDVAAFFSPQDCINFLRFTRSEVRRKHDLHCLHQPQNVALLSVCDSWSAVLRSLSPSLYAPFLSPLSLSLYVDTHSHCYLYKFVLMRQIMLLLELLLIPAFIRTDCGFVVSGREGLCVLLYRLAFPTRLKDMRLVFGLSESCICETFNWMLHFLDYKWGFLLELDVERIKPRLYEFAEAVFNSGSPLTYC